MVEEEDYNKYRSRKFILAMASFAAVSLFAGYGLLQLATSAADVALVIGAWAGSDTAILGFYNYANQKAKDSL